MTTRATRMAGSLRFRLAMTYAGIALLTAAILGGILLSVLANYYASAEEAYLRAAGAHMLISARSVETSSMATWVKVEALRNQVRVRLVNGQGVVLADSGSPDRIDPSTLGPTFAPNGGGGPATGTPQPAGADGGDRLPGPLGAGLFGGGTGSARSASTLDVAVVSSAPAAFRGATTLRLSEGPASGTNALVAVAEAWAIAALLAFVLAVVTGWWVASRISHPIDMLTDASDRMAEGDLAARADVHRDDEVGRLADSFNTMAERTEKTVTSLRRFVGDAAHEIGTPLTALQADLDLADARAGGGDARRLIARAQVQARRLESLSGNLLRLSRIEAGDQAAEPVPLDLNDIARNAADSIASRAEQASLTFTVQTASEALPIVADRMQLLVVAENILDNAVKFTPEGGSIELRTRREGARAILAVSDTGVGIPEAEQAEVFSRFHRARNVANVSGSGLGLAIVSASVDRMGGSVSLAGADPGTVVEVSLPLAGTTTSH